MTRDDRTNRVLNPEVDVSRDPNESCSLLQAGCSPFLKGSAHLSGRTIWDPLQPARFIRESASVWSGEARRMGACPRCKKMPTDMAVAQKLDTKTEPW